MAKIFFVGLDGAENSYRLQTHRPFTVGRDPGNDIVLRDPKVSRHHGDITFERGFFVLRDLASANGTYVNGKRVRVAPLTHGARLRLGNTYGRFSEELPTESDAEPMTTPDAFADPVAVANTEQPVPPTEDFGTPEPAGAPVGRIPTVPHRKIEAAELKKK